MPLPAKCGQIGDAPDWFDVALQGSELPNMDRYQTSNGWEWGLKALFYVALREYRDRYRTCLYLKNNPSSAQQISQSSEWSCCPGRTCLFIVQLWTDAGWWSTGSSFPFGLQAFLAVPLMTHRGSESLPDVPSRSSQARKCGQMQYLHSKHRALLRKHREIRPEKLFFGLKHRPRGCLATF